MDDRLRSYRGQAGRYLYERGLNFRSASRFIFGVGSSLRGIRSSIQASTSASLPGRPGPPSFFFFGGAVARTLRVQEREPLAKRLWVVEEDRIRIRE
jgi:hypothetical protein